MKHILAILLCIGWVQQTQAQSIDLFGVDATNFPTMKGKFYAVDAAGNQQRPSASELTLTENGIPRTITNVSCPPQAPLQAVSVAMSIDISGSMGYSDFGELPVELGKLTATTLCNKIAMPPSEFALQTCDAKAYIVQDFTTNRSKILNAIPHITAYGGNDFVEHLLNNLSGLLNVAKQGKNKRVAVLYTDAWWYALKANELQACLDTCKKYSIEFYAIIYSRKEAEPNGIKASLQQLANTTGGMLFDGITSKAAAEDITQRIQQVTQGGSPCEITWNSDIQCSISNTNIELTWQGNKTTSNYQPLTTALAALKVTPQSIAFGKRNPTTQNDTTITLTAINADFIITGIHLLYGSKDFTVVNTTFPLTIPRNTSKTITLRFIPSDSGSKYAGFEVATHTCSAYLSANGGFPFKKMTTTTLKITHPNGGEQFVVGSDTVITWTGVAPSDTVSLEYSIDNGLKWNTISNYATGLSHIWKKIPSPTSSRCLLRIKQTVKPAVIKDAVIELNGHTGVVRWVTFSPNGRTVATAGNNDNTAKIWDANTGTLLITISGNNGAIDCVDFSPDGNRLLAGCFNNVAEIWDVNTGLLLNTLKGHAFQVEGVSFNFDGSKIITGSVDNTAKIWDSNTGTLLQTLAGHTGYVMGVDFSPDGSKVVTCSYDETAKIWDGVTGKLISTLIGHQRHVLGTVFSPDGNRIATCGGYDSTIKIWDANTGKLLRTISCCNRGYTCISFSPDGNYVAASNFDSTATIWDVNSGVLQQTLRGHKSWLYGVSFSPDGNKIATCSKDGTARIWNLGESLIQSDTSDAVFSIVAPSPAGQDVDMKQCLVSSSKDSLITTFIQNAGTYPFRVDSIAIVGTDASQFQLVSGIPPYTIGASATHAVEFRFKPTSVSSKAAQLLVYTQTDTLRQTIRGEGIAPTLQVLNDIIDFGRVLVGKQRDSLQTTTIKNIGNAPLAITTTRHAGPNDKDFTTIAGGGNFTLQPGEVKTMDLRFTATEVGRTSGRLLFDYNGVGSPATVQLFAEAFVPDTARTTVSVNNITAQAGEKVNLQLVLKKQSGMQLAGAPTDWYARVYYNSSVLYNTQTNNACIGTTDSCVVELNGTYNPTQSELISVPCVVTLGNTDNASITIDEFRWTNNSITTEVVTENGTIHVTGICDEGGVRLFMPSNVSTSLATRPNPAQNTLAIHYGLREPLNVTIELINTTGQVVQTFVQSQQQAKGEYTLNEDISTLGNGVYMLRLVTNKDVLTTRVDVVK